MTWHWLDQIANATPVIAKTTARAMRKSSHQGSAPPAPAVEEVWLS